MYVGADMFMYVGVCGVPKEAREVSPLQAVVCCPMSMLGTDRPSARAVHLTLNVPSPEVPLFHSPLP